MRVWRYLSLRTVLQVKLGPSFLIPNSQIGTFASVTAFKSMVRSRRDMFDVAAAGPVAGGVTALTLLLVGIALSTYTDDASRVRATPVSLQPCPVPQRTVMLKSQQVFGG